MTCALCIEEYYLEKRSVAHARLGISRGLEASNVSSSWNCPATG